MGLSLFCKTQAKKAIHAALTQTLCPQKHKKTAAIIVAGGRSTRFGENKLLKKLLGVEVIVHTLTAYQNAQSVDEIVLVVPEGQENVYREIAARNAISKLTSVVAGGETRQISVYHGASVVSSDVRYFVIGDGARCLTTPDLIDEVVDGAMRYGCATAGVPIVDTVRFVNADDMVERKANRDGLYAIQTPQAMLSCVYFVAYDEARKMGKNATDDETLCFDYGCPVKVVPSSNNNIKLTNPADFAVAERIMKERNA